MYLLYIDNGCMSKMIVKIWTFPMFIYPKVDKFYIES